MNNIANSILFLILIIGFIVLQVYLSKSENKYLGLILPGICFIFSILAVLNVAVFEKINSDTKMRMVHGSVLGMFAVFLIMNIPTAVLMAIYFGERKKYKKKSQLDKMNIQDL